LHRASMTPAGSRGTHERRTARAVTRCTSSIPCSTGVSSMPGGGPIIPPACSRTGIPMSPVPDVERAARTRSIPLGHRSERTPGRSRTDIQEARSPVRSRLVPRFTRRRTAAHRAPMHPCDPPRSQQPVRGKAVPVDAPPGSQGIAILVGSIAYTQGTPGTGGTLVTAVRTRTSHRSAPSAVRGRGCGWS
jgi:hypothetical protein